MVAALGFGGVQYYRAQEAEVQLAAQVAERERLEAQLRAEKERAQNQRAAEAARRQSETAQRAVASTVQPAPVQPAKATSLAVGQVTISGSGTLTLSGTGTEAGGGGGFSLREVPADPVEREKMIRESSARSTNSAYSALYGLAGWTDAQQEQFRDVMYARERAEQELYRAAVADARAKNPQMTRADQYEIYEAMRATAEREDQAAVRQALGAEAAQVLERYQATLQMRYPVRELTTALAAAGTPLAAPQAERLIEVLAAHARGFDGRTDLLALNFDAAAAQMTGLLGDAQLTQLRGIVTRAQERKKVERERNMAPAGSLKSKGQ